MTNVANLLVQCQQLRRFISAEGISLSTKGFVPHMDNSSIMYCKKKKKCFNKSLMWVFLSLVLLVSTAEQLQVTDGKSHTSD